MSENHDFNNQFGSLNIQWINVEDSMLLLLLHPNSFRGSYLSHYFLTINMMDLFAIWLSFYGNIEPSGNISEGNNNALNLNDEFFSNSEIENNSIYLRGSLIYSLVSAPF